MGNATCDVHGVDKTQPFLHAAFADERGDGVGEVHKAAPARHFKPELFDKRFHADRTSLPERPARLQSFGRYDAPPQPTMNQTKETWRRGVVNCLTAACALCYFLNVRR